MAEWINAIQHDIDFVPAWVFWSVDAVKASPLWDGRVVNLQVTDATETSIQLRALMSARTAATCGDLRCEIREKLISFLQSEMPDSLPRHRQTFEGPAGINQARPAAAKTNGAKPLS